MSAEDEALLEFTLKKMIVDNIYEHEATCLERHRQYELSIINFNERMAARVDSFDKYALIIAISSSLLTIFTFVQLFK